MNDKNKIQTKKKKKEKKSMKERKNEKKRLNLLSVQNDWMRVSKAPIFSICLLDKL